MSIAESQPITADDLLTMPDGDRYELVNGELKELHVSFQSSWVAGEVHGQLRDFVRPKRIGWVLPEGTSYQCFPWGLMQVRKPDTSFIAQERLPEGPVGTAHAHIAPDLVVEVVSTHDNANELEAKIADYFEAGVPTIWVVYPEQRSVTIHRLSDRSTRSHLTADQTLTGDVPLAGFSCGVGDLFPPASAESESPDGTEPKQLLNYAVTNHINVDSKVRA